jgi:hypothetical protein
MDSFLSRKPKDSGRGLPLIQKGKWFKKQSLWATVGVTCALFALGCGADVEETRARQNFERSQHNVGQCELSPFLGEELNTSLTRGVPETLVIFNKSFYLEGFSQTLNASSFSIVKTLHQEGVDVFRFPSEGVHQQGCRYFDFLHEPGTEARDHWQEQSANQGVGGRLLGLFTTRYRRNTHSAQSHLEHPTIIVLDLSRKWTLLHEMSHYLYARARARQTNLQHPNHHHAVIEQTDRRLRQLRVQFRQHPGTDTGHQLLQQHQEHFRAQHALDKRTALEEFAIEAMLADYYRRGRVTGVTPGEARTGLNYMRRSGEQVAFSYSRYLDRLRGLRREIEVAGLHELLTPLHRLMREVTEHIDFINRELREANIDLTDGFNLGEALQSTSVPRMHFNEQHFHNRHQKLH